MFFMSSMSKNTYSFSKGSSPALLSEKNRPGNAFPSLLVRINNKKEWCKECNFSCYSKLSLKKDFLLNDLP